MASIPAPDFQFLSYELSWSHVAGVDWEAGWPLMYARLKGMLFLHDDGSPVVKPPFGAVHVVYRCGANLQEWKERSAELTREQILEFGNRIRESGWLEREPSTQPDSPTADDWATLRVSLSFADNGRYSDEASASFLVYSRRGFRGDDAPAVKRLLKDVLALAVDELDPPYTGL